MERLIVDGPKTGRRIMRNCCQIDTACQCSFGALGALALILASAPEGTRTYNEASSLFSLPCVSPCLLIAIMMDNSASPENDLEKGPASEFGIFSFLFFLEVLIARLDGYDQSHSPGGSSEERKDFDDSADELWSLYGNVAQRHDEARIKALKDDMDGIPIYMCAYFPA